MPISLKLPSVARHQVRAVADLHDVARAQAEEDAVQARHRAFRPRKAAIVKAEAARPQLRVVTGES